jgi:hypothetical protein
MKLFKTTIKCKDCAQSPVVAIDRDEDRSLDAALNALSYHHIDADSIELIETKEII